MSKSFGFLGNPFDDCSSSEEVWAVFIDRQRSRGFDGVLIYNYALTPVRSQYARAESDNNQVTGEANNMVFLINTPYDPAELLNII